MRIHGITECANAFENLNKKVATTICRKGLRKGAKVTLNVARAEAPVKTGAVRRNIKVRAGKSNKGVIRLKVGCNAKDFTGGTFYIDFILYG